MISKIATNRSVIGTSSYNYTETDITSERKDPSFLENRLQKSSKDIINASSRHNILNNFSMDFNSFTDDDYEKLVRKKESLSKLNNKILNDCYNIELFYLDKFCELRKKAKLSSAKLKKKNEENVGLSNEIQYLISIINSQN